MACRWNHFIRKKKKNQITFESVAVLLNAVLIIYGLIDKQGDYYW